MMYPLAEYDGPMKRIDWSTIPRLPNPATGDEEVKWVVPEKFFDELAAILADAPPLPGEEARYAQVLAVLDAANGDEAIKQAMIDGCQGSRRTPRQAAAAVPQLRPAASAPLEHDLQRVRLRHGLFHPHRGGQVEHLRQLAERDEILLSGPRRRRRAAQRRQSLHRHVRRGADAAGERILVADALQRASLLRAQRDQPLFARHEEQRPAAEPGRLADNPCAGRRAAINATNWLPAPAGKDFSLYLRAYWPKVAITDGSWTPPAVQQVS